MIDELIAYHEGIVRHVKGMMNFHAECIDMGVKNARQMHETMKVLWVQHGEWVKLLKGLRDESIRGVSEKGF